MSHTLYFNMLANNLKNCSAWRHDKDVFGVDQLDSLEKSQGMIRLTAGNEAGSTFTPKNVSSSFSNRHEPAFCKCILVKYILIVLFIFSSIWALFDLWLSDTFSFEKFDYLIFTHIILFIVAIIGIFGTCYESSLLMFILVGIMTTIGAIHIILMVSLTYVCFFKEDGEEEILLNFPEKYAYVELQFRAFYIYASLVTEYTFRTLC
ncbi:hypothetical protein Y032_0071g591 [Ancylostoma ceylanicum]|uniref:Uncharacterized protein n=3 Tax=Ancylostoma ceylanicum TaxID=53326 RepID=A0A016TW85_9BILA|nr:hypothetical protein Y032_0071g591 [Ancylostoma ceylanicum]